MNTKNTSFEFVQLNPREQEQPEYDLGIEVTIKGQKNHIDHHGEKAKLPSATKQISDALVNSLTQDDRLLELAEKENIRIATVRPDADSLTAMAVLVSHKQNRAINQELIEIVDIIDRFGPSQIPEQLQQDELKALYTTIGGIAADHTKSLSERVGYIQDCLDGSINPEIIATYVAKKQKDFEDARKNLTLTDIIPGKVVYVEGNHRFAMSLGYESAPVVIAYNPAMQVFADGKPTGETYGKYTIGLQSDAVDFPLDTVVEILNGKEPGRGGRGTIAGSPQNVSSVLTPEQVLEIVKVSLALQKLEREYKEAEEEREDLLNFIYASPEWQNHYYTSPEYNKYIKKYNLLNSEQLSSDIEELIIQCNKLKEKINECKKILVIK